MSKIQLVQEQATRNMVNDLKHGAETLQQALAGTEAHTIRVGVGVSQKEELNMKRICLVLNWY